MDDRRVAVTGIGLITAIGGTRDETWRAMVDGRCGIKPLTLFDTTGYRARQAAQIGSLPVDSRFTPRSWARLSRSDQAAVIASREALMDAGLPDNSLAPDRMGVLLAAGTGDLLRNETWVFESMERGVRRAAPGSIYGYFPSTPGDVVASLFGFEGLKVSPLSACSSSTVAIGHAADAIRHGRIDAALAGASDVLSRLTFSGFNALRLVDDEPCRPFCATRKGMNIGEAGAVLVLEEMGRARRRGARIYAELLGYGVMCEAYHPTSPEPEGRAVEALLLDACRAARVSTSDIDHVNAHGTATPQNDQAEARGIRRALGDRGARVPVTSIKSMVGHCLAAAGAVEAAALALSISTGIIPPTINHRENDPACDVDLVVSGARETRLFYGVSTSLAFGGNNAALVMRRVA